MKNLLFILFIGSIISCSESPYQKEDFILKSYLDQNSKGQKLPQMEIELNQVLNQHLTDSSIFNENTCPAYLQNLTSRFEDKAYRDFIEVSEKAYLAFEKPSRRILNTLFLIRLELRKKLSEFFRPTKECVDAVRKTLRYARYAEESIAEWYVTRVRQKDLLSKDFESDNPLQKIVNPKYYNTPEDFRFESGDLLLVRGTTFVSATIARLGDEEGQFSHAAIIYKPEPGTGLYGKTYVLESLIETGVIVRELDEWLEQGHARHVVYRAKGNMKDLAHYAAESIFVKLQHQLYPDGSAKTGRDFLKSLNHPNTIYYNFSMDLDNEKEVFCSQLLRIAFRNASNGKIELPTFPTSFEKLHNYPLLNSLTVRTKSTFAPSDLEVEPLVDLVAEYRNLTKLENGLYKTQQVKMQDAFFSMFFTWMTENEYRVHTDQVDTALKNIAKVIGKGVNGIGKGSTKLPSNAPGSFLEKVIAMHFAYSPISEIMVENEMDFFNSRGYSTPFAEMKKGLEKHTHKNEFQKSMNPNQNVTFFSVADFGPADSRRYP